MTNRSKFKAAARPINSKRAFTLVETLISLMLLVSLVILWQPVLKRFLMPQWGDDELLRVQQTTNALNKMTEGIKMRVESPHMLSISSYFVSVIYSPAAKNYVLRATTGNGGFMSLMQGVKAVTYTQITPYKVRYQLVMRQTGRIYEGVIESETP